VALAIFLTVGAAILITAGFYGTTAASQDGRYEVA
jgi:hypothetical protein